MSREAPTELETIAWLDHAGDLIRKQMAEIEQLKAEAEQHLRAYQHQFNEVERLRAALQRIADMCPATAELTLAHEMADNAMAALVPKP